MPAPLLSIETRPELPDQADVVVIGAGIVGSSAAYWLARAGKSVVLLEKGHVGSEQSSRNWGWCRQQNRDARELLLATISLDLWEDMARDIGEDLGFRRCGLLYLSNNDEEIQKWADWGVFARGEGVDTRMLTPAEAQARAKVTGQEWKGGVWSPTDGIADTSRAVPIICKGVEKHGGRVIQNCAARGLELSAGRVSAVVTERGTIRTSQVVMAGGAWAGSFLHQQGINFPQATIRSTALSVRPGALELPPALHTSRITITRRGDGGHTLAISGLGQVDPTPGLIAGARHFVPMFARRWRLTAPGGLQAWKAGFATRSRWALDAETPMERTRSLDPYPNPRVANEAMRRARLLIPALQSVGMQHAWAGFIDSTPDGVPVIDNDLAVPGLLLAAGFSGHGFGIGPGSGHLVADLILGRTPITDTAHYTLKRFNRSAWGKVSEF